MEGIFQKIDSDGSGSLDIDELVSLFHDNKVHLDREVIREIFQGNEFTLEKFRQMIYDEIELNKFHSIIHNQKDKIIMRNCMNKGINFE